MFQWKKFLLWGKCCRDKKASTSVGCCQLVNKMDEVSGGTKTFNRNDEQFLEAFAIFCGLAIQNTQMYETVERAMAKQQVTLEVSTRQKFGSEVILSRNSHVRLLLSAVY